MRFRVHDRAAMESYEVCDRFGLEERLGDSLDLGEEAVGRLCRFAGFGYVGDDEDVLNVSVEPL